ncbi:GNAT family N-acetyltransferase [Geobacter pickeringii]|uniref:GNAT family N-acetyltransferase n=1 Tax=Geobacter pickeringii TaxID=345632 RepID=UPI0011854612|nr:GNAT family N-acetyltransferase [Geobacter pickeringii]
MAGENELIQGCLGKQFMPDCIYPVCTVEIADSWKDMGEVCGGWERLEAVTGIEHPFVSLSWLECWIRSFSNFNKIHLVKAVNDKLLTAVVPLVQTRKNIKGINFQCLSFPANGHSPQCDVLVEPKDQLTLEAVSRTLREVVARTDLLVFPAVREGGNTMDVLRSLNSKRFLLHVEHSFEVPYFETGGGWHFFLEGKSKKFRRRLVESRQLAAERGTVSTEFYHTTPLPAAVIERLRDLDSKTWQHADGTGLFSTHQNSEFYTGLLGTRHQTFDVTLAFLRVDSADIAYEITVIRNSTAYFLKYGFDPAWSDCRPGVLVQAALSEYVSDRGCTRIELGPESSEEKRRWENNRFKSSNYWLINMGTPKGVALGLALTFRKWLKSSRCLKC